MAEKTIAEPIYRIIFDSQGDVYELYTLFIYQSEMYGFVEVEELIFDDSQIAEAKNQEEGSGQQETKRNFEKLKREFAGVKRSFIPLPSIIRIDEMEKPGVVKVTPAKGESTGNVRHFPTHAFKRPPLDTDDSTLDD